MPSNGSLPVSDDIRNRAAYPLAEAARYLKLPVATLRSWAVGRTYETRQGRRHFPALLELPARRVPVLSFWNLVEAHVLRALRIDHQVSVKHVRQAIRFAESELRIERLLLSSELSAGAGRMFLDRYGRLIDLSASGQMAMRQMFEAHLSRLERDSGQFPIRLYPFLSTEPVVSDRPIAIDPSIAFGRPVLVSRGVTTAVIRERIDAGEAVQSLTDDYDLAAEEIGKAILYERAA